MVLKVKFFWDITSRRLVNMFMKKKWTKIEGAMLLRNLFLQNEYTYIKQEVTTLVYDITIYNITTISFFFFFFFFTFLPCILILSKFFNNECTSDCLKNNIKIYIKIAPTCFGVVTPPSGISLSVLATVTI
jgi:hypothetical protein